jgi:hypothetical protein
MILAQAGICKDRKGSPKSGYDKKNSEESDFSLVKGKSLYQDSSCSNRLFEGTQRTQLKEIRDVP